MNLRQKVLSVAAAMITGLTCANFLLLGYGGKVNPISLVFLASAIGAFFIGAFLIFLKKTVFSRLERHLKQLQEIAVSGDFNRRLGLGDNSYPRDDELTALGQEINRLLEELEKTRDKLRQYEARLKITVDNVRDLICLTDNSFKLQFVSPSVKSFLGYTPNELRGWNIFNLIYEPDRPKLRQLYQQITAGHPGIDEEVRFCHRDGSLLWSEVNGKLLFDEPGQVEGVVIAARNIEKRKKAEADLIYLTLHDPVTGLFNRRHFESELDRLQRGGYYPVTIIVADMDHLSLINDTMGHSHGDSLLKICADILNNRVGAKGKNFRIGGDEFAIILPCTEAVETKELLEEIQADVAYYNRDHPGLPLSISLGLATGKNGTERLTEIYQQADDQMYRNKLYRTIKNRDQTRKTILEAFSKKDQISDGRAARIKHLCLKLGRQIGFSEARLEKLALFAEMYDLGKTGIPKRILFKEGPLTPEERNIIRRHPENGYRIACSSPELAPIADLILLHHERWDGTGYPLGLEGGQIPVECRILAIIDAYENMTNPSHDGTVLSKKEAVAELQRCVGSQFDPQLVQIFSQLI